MVVECVGRGSRMCWTSKWSEWLDASCRQFCSFILSLDHRGEASQII